MTDENDPPNDSTAEESPAETENPESHEESASDETTEERPETVTTEADQSDEESAVGDSETADEADDNDATVERESGGAQEAAEEVANAAAEEVANAATQALPGVADLVERAEDSFEQLVADLDANGETEAAETLDELRAVMREADELLSTVDAEELPETVDISRLPDAIDAEEIPDAVMAGDAGDAVDLEELARLVELSDLWDAVDLREFWRNKREFDEAVDDVASNVTDDGSADDADDESGFFGGMADDVGGGSDAETSDEAAEDDELTPDLGMLEDEETTQTAIQVGVSETVDEFRDALLEAHVKLERLVEENESRSQTVDQPNSRNPTAVSTMPGKRSGHVSVGQHSTVPSETRYSTAPNRKRIYGSRFEREVEGDDE